MCSAIIASKSRDNVQADARPYALGYSDDEFKRLERQGGYYRDLTEDVLVRAGIGPGMRVLDIGCGVGDVSLIAGRLVGPTGSVLGVDRSSEAIETAARRTAQAGQAGWVGFAAAELRVVTPETRARSSSAPSSATSTRCRQSKSATAGPRGRGTSPSASACSGEIRATFSVFFDSWKSDTRTRRR